MAIFPSSLTLSSACRNIASRKYCHFRTTQPRRFKSRLGTRVALAAGVATTTVYAFPALGSSDASADVSDFANAEDSTIRNIPLTFLLRSYFVFSVCSVPALVDWSPHIISFTTSVPGLKQLAGVLVRWSFFAQVRIHFGRHGCQLITLVVVRRRRYCRGLYISYPPVAK